MEIGMVFSNKGNYELTRANHLAFYTPDPNRLHCLDDNPRGSISGTS